MGSRTLVETLSGTNWTVTPSPKTTWPINELYGFSCRSSASCYVVGVQGTDSAQSLHCSSALEGWAAIVLVSLPARGGPRSGTERVIWAENWLRYNTYRAQVVQ